jgi:hypothetical protein
MRPSADKVAIATEIENVKTERNHAVFEDRHHKDQPAVKAMAQRIADNSPQVLVTTDDFVAAYGQEASDMVAKGGLLAALWDIGIDAVPATFWVRRNKSTKSTTGFSLFI